MKEALERQTGWTDELGGACEHMGGTDCKWEESDEKAVKADVANVMLPETWVSDGVRGHLHGGTHRALTAIRFRN